MECTGPALRAVPGLSAERSVHGWWSTLLTACHCPGTMVGWNKRMFSVSAVIRSDGAGRCRQPRCNSNRPQLSFRRRNRDEACADARDMRSARDGRIRKRKANALNLRHIITGPPRPFCAPDAIGLGDSFACTIAEKPQHLNIQPRLYLGRDLACGARAKSASFLRQFRDAEASNQKPRRIKDVVRVR